MSSISHTLLLFEDSCGKDMPKKSASRARACRMVCNQHIPEENESRGQKDEKEEYMTQEEARREQRANYVQARKCEAECGECRCASTPKVLQI